MLCVDLWLRSAARRVLRVPDEVLGLLSEEARRVAERLDLSGDERLKAILEDLYWRAGLSSRQVAGLLGVDGRLLRRMMARLGVERRGRVEALKARLTRYAKRPFTGSPAERVRIHALIAGDAHVRPHRAQVEVTTSTPNPWLIQLIHDLLRPYTEHFHLYPFYNKKTKQYSWRLSILLDSSFTFLKQPVTVDLEDDEQFWEFMASIIEAEGCIEVYAEDGLASARIRVYNDMEYLVDLAYGGLTRRGFSARKYTEKPRYSHGEVKYSHVICVDDDAVRLLKTLKPRLMHFEKLLRARLAMKVVGLSWGEAAPLVDEVERVVALGVSRSKDLAAKLIKARGAHKDT